MNTVLLDHLWQSTVVLAGVGLLTLFFRRNGAHVRHALWTAASLKFLLPFAVLNALGHYVSTLLAARPVQPPVVQAVYAASQPFSDGPVFVALPAPSVYLLPATLVWGAGILVVATFWLLRWRKLGAALRDARDSGIAAPMPVKFSPTLLEPGLVGIFHPVLLLPEGIAEKLIPAELQAIIAHEACHLRRRDNLIAAAHMLVETLFWFWPPVWWLGTRLIAERERACDEAVLRAGNDPQTYAESILKVCKHYVSSPLACASGVSGADLKQRMEDIMKNTVIARLNIPKKALITASALVALLSPVLFGLLDTPPLFAQTIGMAPRPGTQVALRHVIEAWEMSRPAPELMTQFLSAPLREQQASIQKKISVWGPLKSITFKRVDQGMLVNDVPYDIYSVEFQNARTLWAILPLSRDGKVQDVQFHKVALREDANTPSAGTEGALRRLIDGIYQGDMPTDALMPILARGPIDGMTRQDAQALGPLKSLMFKGVGFLGYDEYEATYEHGRAFWSVEPLMADGRMNMALVSIAKTAMPKRSGS